MECQLQPTRIYAPLPPILECNLRRIGVLGS